MSVTATRRRVGHVMGLPISLALRGDQAHGDRVFSTYRQDSSISRLGRGELSVAQCPPEVAEVLALGEVARRESSGAFDVRRRTEDGQAILDPSGVVKGWAVQRASRHLNALRATDFCLGAGGDLTCHVADPGSDPWQIGVEDPHDPTRLLARIPVRRGGVATSGFAHRGAHVIDARTGLAPQGVASVTVVAHDLTTADIDATCALALGPDALPWLAARSGRTGLVVLPDGTEHVVGRLRGTSHRR